MGTPTASANAEPIAPPPQPLGEDLSPEQRKFLDEQGYIHFSGFLTPDEVDFLLRETQELERRWIAEGRTKAFGIPIKYGRDLNGQPFVNRFAFTSMYSKPIHEFLGGEKFKRIARILGDGFRLGEDEKDGMVVNHYLNQGGSRYKQLGWHTDGLRDIFLGHELRPLWQVGLYLDDSPIEKGGLRLIPGTHRDPLHKMLLRKWYFIDHKPDPNEVCVTAKCGDLTIHDGRLWHRVARATVEGEASRRRVIYLPFVDGPRHPKDENSPTPLYHYLQRITG